MINKLVQKHKIILSGVSGDIKNNIIANSDVNNSKKIEYVSAGEGQAECPNRIASPSNPSINASDSCNYDSSSVCESENDLELEETYDIYGVDSVSCNYDSRPNSVCESENDIEIEHINDNIGVASVANAGESFATGLKEWAISNNITITALGQILKLIKSHTNLELPADGRTLLQTPRHQKIDLIDGRYQHYFGILPNLLKTLQCLNCSFSIENLYLVFNVDGIPIFKSSNLEFWPILCKIKGIPCNPFVVSIYAGKGKPSVENFLQPFIDEIKFLCTEGFMFNNKLIKVFINYFVCDSPARAFLKQCKSHTGYYACERCFIKGEYKSHSMSYHVLTNQVRTNDNFRNMEQELHHIGESPLCALDIDMIHSFVLDPMHLLMLGVQRRLLNMWCNVVPFKIHRSSKLEINDNLTEIKKYIPSEFNRKCRPLNELDRYKATELRLFLCYIGPVVFQSHLEKKVFNHYLLLFFAIRVLNNKLFIRNEEDIEYARQLLQKFVKNYNSIYKNANVVLNVHNLLHVADDVERYGTLDEFSAYPFENMLGVLKRRVRSGSNAMQQICARITEMSHTGHQCIQKKFSNNSITLENGHIKLNSFKDSFVKLNNGKVGFVKNNNGSIIFYQCLKREPAFKFPCDSSYLDIYKTSKKYKKKS